jgi:levanase
MTASPPRPEIPGLAPRLRDRIRPLARRRHRRALVTILAILLVAALVVTVRGMAGPSRRRRPRPAPPTMGSTSGRRASS